MNRFKFRVWDKLNNIFIDAKEYYISAFGTCIHWPSGDSGDDFIIQQYTGFKDKNGLEIFEGDILKRDNLNYKIIWAGWQWIATCPNYNRNHWPKFEHFREVQGGEIVGNIFENIELLK